jgi:RNA polymerase sigma-B factor
LNINPENTEIPDKEIKVWLDEYKNTDEEKAKIQLRTLILHYYQPLVKKISHGLARRQSDPIEDIIQVGCVGLMKAIDQFDETQGASFKTYATYRVTGEIRHYLRDKASIIRAPRELLELSFRMNLIIEKLQSKMGRTPTEVEIANELQIPVKRINEVFEVDRRKQTISLDQIANLSEKEQSLGERIIDDKYQEYQNLQEERIMLKEAVELLPDYLKEIIQMSFFDDFNQNEIAQKVGISQMQVSRRIKKATNELFNIITARENQRSR